MYMIFILDETKRIQIGKHKGTDKQVIAGETEVIQNGLSEMHLFIAASTMVELTDAFVP